MRTIDDMRAQVEETLDGRADEFDVETIVETIHRRYGLIDINHVPSEEYWTLVEQQDRATGTRHGS